MRRQRIFHKSVVNDRVEKRGQMSSAPDQRSPLSHLQRSLADPMVQLPLNPTAIANRESDQSWGVETLSNAGRSSIANGPFNQAMNTVLTACFGPEVAGLQANFGDDRFNASIGARASTLGSAMLFGEGITQNMDDPFSMEVIGHEVAHALNKDQSNREVLIDQPGDVGEMQAKRAGRDFANYLTGDRLAQAPKLSPAVSGQALIHRSESSEHANAIDMARERLLLNVYLSNPESLEESDRHELEELIRSDDRISTELEQLRTASDRPEVGAVDTNVLTTMEQRVMLANGEEVSPGEITAMMGDFYGAFDDDGNFDPAESFRQMNEADPTEMRELINAINRESDGEEIAPAEWEEITRGRREGESYLELAKRNDSHFSGRTMSEGTDHNMGAYTAFHQLALQAAQEEGGEARARALEASAMHYLTDRHASGHAFNKAEAMEASGVTWSDDVANLYALTVHDEFNREGRTVENAAGEAWYARGDGHWADRENTANRSRTAMSAYASYNELNQVVAGGRTSEDIQNAGYAAYGTVPQFSEESQNDANKRASELGFTDVVWANKDRAGILPHMAAWWVEDTASDVWDWTTDTASDVGSAVADTASDAWDWTTDTASDVGSTVAGTASDAWDWTTDTALDVGSTVADTASDVGSAVADTASDAWDWATDW